MQKKTVLLLALLGIFSSRSYALDRLFYCGKLFDPIKGLWVNSQVLHERGGTIVGINPKKLPQPAEVHDFKNSFCLPGLIDSHTHLFISDLSYSKDFARGSAEFIRTTSSADRKKLGLDRAYSLLRLGFTAVRDLGNDGGLDIRKLENERTPHLYSSGKGFAPEIGQLPSGTNPKILKQEYDLLTGSPDVRLKNFQFDLLKLYADEDPNPAVTDAKLLKEWVSYARKKDLRVAVHAIFKTSIDNTLQTEADTLEHGNEITTEQLKKLKKKKMIFVPSNANALLIDQAPLLKLPGVKEQFEQYCNNVKAASKLGVEIAFGSDNYFSLEKQNISFGEATIKALIRSSQCGLTPAQVIRSATITAAKTVGKENVLGVLKEGASLDLIVLERDPLGNLNELLTPKKVYKSGFEVK